MLVNLAILALFFSRRTSGQIIVEPPFEPDCCALDLIFLLDETCGCGTMDSDDNCEAYKDHVKSIISSFNTGNKKVRVGIVAYHDDTGSGYTTVYNELGTGNSRSRLMNAVDMMDCSKSSLYSLARKGFDAALDQFDNHAVRDPPIVKRYLIWLPRCKPDERTPDEEICNPLLLAALNLHGVEVFTYSSGGCVKPERYRCLSDGNNDDGQCEWMNCDYDPLVYQDHLSEVLMCICPAETSTTTTTEGSTTTSTTFEPSPSPTFPFPPRVTSEGCPSNSIPNYGPLRPNNNCRNQGTIQINPDALETKSRFKLIDKCWIVLDNLFYDPLDDLMRFDWHCTGRGCTNLNLGITEVLMLFQNQNRQLSYPYAPMVEHDECLTVQDTGSPLPHIISSVQVCFE